MSPASAPRQLGHLLWPLWRGVVNAPRARHGRTPARLLVFGLLGLLFMAGSYFGARWLFGAFLDAEFLAELLIRRTVGIVLLFFTGLLVFSSTVTAFSTYFAADDLPLLMSAPVPIGRLYFARLGDTWLQSSWMMLVFALPMLAACGPVLAAPWWYYAALPGVLLPLTVICAAAGSLVSLLLARLFPAHRTQEVLVVLALLGFVGLYLAFRMADPERFLQPDGFGDLMSLIAGLKAAEAPLSPSDWTVAVLFGLLRGEAAGLLWPGLCLLTAAPAVCALGAWLARATYRRSYQISQEGRRSERRIPGLRRRRARVPRSVGHAFAWRDTRIFFRTTSQWTQLLLVAVLIVVFVFNFRHFGALQQAGILGPTGLFFTNIALGGLVITTIAVRFLYPAVSMEGLGYWAVQVAPITATELLRAKVRWGFWPLTLLSLGLTLVSNALVELPGSLFLASALLTVLVTYALTGMGVGLGAMTPRFDIDNPARIASGMGGVVFMLLGLLYLIVVTALLAWPVYALRYGFSHGWWPRGWKFAAMIALIVVALALTALAHHLPMRLGARALDRGE